MGIRYSELPQTQSPTSSGLVAFLDPTTSTLRTATIDKTVDCALGSASIQNIGDGTVKGAIVYLNGAIGGAAVTSMTYAQYNALTTAQKNDGHLRLVTD